MHVCLNMAIVSGFNPEGEEKAVKEAERRHASGAPVAVSLGAKGFRVGHVKLTLTSHHKSLSGADEWTSCSLSQGWGRQGRGHSAFIVFDLQQCL